MVWFDHSLAMDDALQTSLLSDAICLRFVIKREVPPRKSIKEIDCKIFHWCRAENSVKMQRMLPTIIQWRSLYELIGHQGLLWHLQMCYWTLHEKRVILTELHRCLTCIRYDRLRSTINGWSYRHQNHTKWMKFVWRDQSQEYRSGVLYDHVHVCLHGDEDCASWNDELFINWSVSDDFQTFYKEKKTTFESLYCSRKPLWSDNFRIKFR